MLEPVAAHQALIAQLLGLEEQPSSSKTALDVAFCHYDLVGGAKVPKELGLGNAGYRVSDQMLYFSTVGLIEQSKAPEIKRLE